VEQEEVTYRWAGYGSPEAGISSKILGKTLRPKMLGGLAGLAGLRLQRLQPKVRQGDRKSTLPKK
jgi:hypothetical protein